MDEQSGLVARRPERVVSLYPSMTRSLIDFGFSEQVAGVTDYCPWDDDLHPITRLGGVKDPDRERILALRPDLVIANQEENGRLIVEALREAGLKVWVTFPQSVDEAIMVLRELGVRMGDPKRTELRVMTLERAIEWQRAANDTSEPVSVFCPIWYEERSAHGEWWMTANRDTYLHSVLELCGGRNIFADRQRRYPLAADLGQGEQEDAGERDVRYPRVTAEEIQSAAPELILLPDEPYAFDEGKAEELRARLPGVPAVRNGHVYVVPGSLLTWHGTTLAGALAELPSFFDRCR